MYTRAHYYAQHYILAHHTYYVTQIRTVPLTLSYPCPDAYAHVDNHVFTLWLGIRMLGKHIYGLSTLWSARVSIGNRLPASRYNCRQYTSASAA
jgi:hypothetical protein